MIRKHLVSVAFSWLIIAGIVHFSIDVISHALQGRHPPGQAAPLYFGMHSAFALGQIVFGVFALMAIAQAPRIMTRPLFILSLSAGAAWLLFAWLFIDYPQPRFATGGFLVLLLTSWMLRQPRI